METPTLPRRSFSLEEWAAQHGISTRSAYRVVKSGDLKIFKIGRLQRVTVEEAEDYIRRNAELSAAEDRVNLNMNFLESLNGRHPVLRGAPWV